jgi:hypothetical protein
MIVRDEEGDLPRCLASLQGVFDELVVVDTGSRDRTAAIATAAGARIVEHVWQHDFAAARNVGIAAATCDWAMIIDADEELPAASREALRGEVARAEASGLSALTMWQHNLMPPGELTAWEELPQVRLFKRTSAARYEGRIHEQIAPAIARAGGAIGPTELRLTHYGYAKPTAQGGEARARRNLALLERAVADAPDDAYLMFQLGTTQKAVGDPAAAASLTRALALDAPAQVKALTREAEAGARMKLAQLALARRADAVAIEEARRCLAIQPANPTALQIVVVGCVTLGRLPEAAKACKQLLACPSLAERSRGELGQLLKALGG